MSAGQPGCRRVPDSCHLTSEAFDGYFAGHMNAGVMEAMADFAVAGALG
ncbi:hypothetical protein [Acetobacterium sp. KB-1]|nr:hypothetical protein [Acetobacterium sp. KB-1]